MTALIVTLVVIGASLLIVEAHVASYGVLGLAGVAALATAGVLTVGSLGGSVLLGLLVMLPAVAIAAWLVSVVARKSLAVRGRRPRGGAGGPFGRMGRGRPRGGCVAGERWRAPPA